MILQPSPSLPGSPTSPTIPVIRTRTPFSTLLHLIPLLAILVTVSAAAPLAFLFLLQRTVRHVLIVSFGNALHRALSRLIATFVELLIQATALAIPFILTATSWWAFIASFEDDSSSPGTSPSIDPSSNWWSTTGLRIFALLPLALAALFGRMVWKRRKRLERTVAVVEVCVG